MRMGQTWHNKTSHHCSELSLDRSSCHYQQPNTTKKDRNGSQNTSGYLKPCHNVWHGFATRNYDHWGFCFTPSVVKQCFERVFKHSTYCLGDTTRSVQWVMVQDKPSRVLGIFVLDDSRPLFNQSPSDSRNGCRAREEPLKPSQKIFLSSTSFFLVETN